MSNQLVLWEGQPVPVSRARALVKVEKQLGAEQAAHRALVFASGSEMRKIIAEKTAGQPGKSIITRIRQVNRANRIDGVNKCGPEKWPTVKIGYDLMAAAYRNCETAGERKQKIAQDMEWLGGFVDELARRIAA